MCKLYNHPGDPYHVARVYRAFLIGQKRNWMASGTKGHRCLRALLNYRALLLEQRAAQRLILDKRPKMNELVCILRQIADLKRTEARQ